jgi:hypothetical protein
MDYTFLDPESSTKMEELITNLHIHTYYSDGHATHAQLAKIASNAGLDCIITTDHNVLVNGMDAIIQENNRKVLVMVGEEIHDPMRDPQRNHMLVFGAGRELSSFGSDPQRLINQVQQNNGVCFLAHPFEDALPLFHEGDYSWVDWQVSGYTGIELWNGLSEMKSHIHSVFDGIIFAFFPQLLAHSPNQRTLQKWDELLSSGKKVVVVGGSDSHALPKHMGPLKRTIFPYSYHFRAVNTHIFTRNGITGNISSDKADVLQALRQGHCFVGYDLPAPARGFRFTAHGKDQTAICGDEINLSGSITFQIHLPMRAECCLLKDGKVIRAWKDRDTCTFIADQPGVYRVECYTQYLGKRRGWIYSNPIYVRAPQKNGII